MASIRDVAKQAGVSPATVSRAFATPELINEHTQQRVFEAARLLNYRPPRLRGGGAITSAVAARRTVASSRHPVGAMAGPEHPASSGAIGFQFFSATPNDPLGQNVFYAAVLSGAQAEAAALGLHLLVHSTDRHALSVEMPRMVQERAIGGMLLVGTADPAVLHAFAHHVPEIVLVDHRDEGGSLESVLSDGFGGAHAATRYLLSLGHRRLGFLDGEAGVPTFQDRLRGWVCAQFEAGMTVDRDWLIPADDDEQVRYGALVTLLRRPEAGRPTALLCANDHNALVALRACREAGLRVPNDLSLIGFDDTYWAAHAAPPLTTVRVDKEQLGRLAVRRLAARLRGEVGSGSLPPVCHTVPVSLVPRESCRPVGHPARQSAS